MLVYLTLLSALMWCGLLLAPWRPWSSAPFLEVGPHVGSARAMTAGEITVLIPARNEADTIATTLRAVQAQNLNLDIIVVDDQSSDGTDRVAQTAAPEIRLIAGQPLAPGWSGKLWALEQARQFVTTPLTLLLDADVELQAGAVKALLTSMHRDGLGLVSLMAMPSMEKAWERLLMPAFIYFFKLIYPFHLSNNPRSRIAAAAGGCILIKTGLLAEIGGFAALKTALIDDCSLARLVKTSGQPIWIGLTHAARSQRPYTGLAQIWAMVSRTAFTQLRYSISLLLACTLLMALAFWLPVAGLFQANKPGVYLALTACIAMLASYLPVLRFYGRSSAWALCLPVIGTLYLAMTWSSAIRYWRGERASWKQRVYTRSGVVSSSGEP